MPWIDIYVLDSNMTLTGVATRELPREGELLQLRGGAIYKVVAIRHKVGAKAGEEHAKEYPIVSVDSVTEAEVEMVLGKFPKDHFKPGEADEPAPVSNAPTDTERHIVRETLLKMLSKDNRASFLQWWNMRLRMADECRLTKQFVAAWLHGAQIEDRRHNLKDSKPPKEKPSELFKGIIADTKLLDQFLTFWNGRVRTIKEMHQAKAICEGWLHGRVTGLDIIEKAGPALDRLTKVICPPGHWICQYCKLVVPDTVQECSCQDDSPVEGELGLLNDGPE